MSHEKSDVNPKPSTDAAPKDPLMENTSYYGDESPHARGVSKKAPVQPRSLKPHEVKDRGSDDTIYFS